MSVPKNKRTESEVAFYTESRKIYIDLAKFIMKDFGTTHSYRDLKTFTHKAKMKEEDEALFKELCKTYSIDVEAVYPEYLLDHFRTRILDDVADAADYVVEAYSLYPRTQHEFNIRRDIQSRAISQYQKIKNTLTVIIELFHNVNLEKYVPIVKKIDNEIVRLKEWRKDCNKLRKGCMMNDMRAQVEAAKEAERVKEEIDNPQAGDNEFLSKILDVRSITRNEVYLNTLEYMKSIEQMDGNGTLVPPSKPVACVLYSDKDGVVINVGIGKNFKSFEAKKDANNAIVFKPKVEKSNE